MTVTWPKDTRAQFGKSLIQASHDLHTREQFTDEGLAQILDDYPREELGIWTFGGHCEGMGTAIKGKAPNASGKEILEAVKRGTFWLNLRKCNEHVGYLEDTADDIFDSLEDATDKRLRKRDMGLLISSPEVHVNYHLDIPLVCLLQLRGEKRIWMYPADEHHAPSAQVEDIVHTRREEDLTFSNAFDDNAEIVDLKPGMAITWPQTAPHRVQNADCVNVSLSCEYMTLPALVQANAIYMNGVLRSKFGVDPVRTKQITPLNLGKAAMARLVKAAARAGAPKSPSPVEFEIDLSEEACFRPV